MLALRGGGSVPFQKENARTLNEETISEKASR